MHTHRFQGSRIHAGREALLLLLDTQTTKQRRDTAPVVTGPRHRRAGRTLFQIFPKEPRQESEQQPEQV